MTVSAGLAGPLVVGTVVAPELLHAGAQSGVQAATQTGAQTAAQTATTPGAVLTGGNPLAQLAFTGASHIEVLVAVGLLLILAGLLAVGYAKRVRPHNGRSGA